MTIEDALDILEDNYTVLYSHGNYTEQEENEALIIAIKSLEALVDLKKEIVDISATDADSQLYALIRKSDVLNIIDRHLMEVRGE